jgi:hypothetical protein
VALKKAKIAYELKVFPLKNFVSHRMTVVVQKKANLSGDESEDMDIKQDSSLV